MQAGFVHHPAVRRRRGDPRYGGQYRRALQETVAHYSGWKPSAADIDGLKAEGSWNNDWDASLELLRRAVAACRSVTP